MRIVKEPTEKKGLAPSGGVEAQGPVGCVKRFRDDTPRSRPAFDPDRRACQRRRLPVCRRQRGSTHPTPDSAWMCQIARNLVDDEDGFLRGKRYLLMDRDGKYCPEFRAVLRHGGVKALRLPPRSPNLNAFAERFVRSIKS